MSFALRFPFSGIVSRQPARTTLRFRSESAADASASGVRSGTQPTVMVAKGKIVNCRVLRAISQTARFLGPPKLLFSAQDRLTLRRFP
jgi:hypothetical protein